MTITYVFIACCSHSGSTLLEMLLGRHPSILAVGEACHLTSYTASAEIYCGCGIPLAQCPLWHEAMAVLTEGTALPLPESCATDPIRPTIFPWMYGALMALWERGVAFWERVPGSVAQDNRQRYQRYWQVIRRATELTHRSVVVDASMSPSRILELARWLPPESRLKVIHLVRDGRAVTYSHMHNFGTTAQQAAQCWHRVNRNILWARRFTPTIEQVTCHYEDICRTPSETLTHLGDFIGISYDPCQLDFRGGVQHGIGGNPMRFREEREIRLDTRWKSALSHQDIKTFERIAGTMNRGFGYT